MIEKKSNDKGELIDLPGYSPCNVEFPVVISFITIEL